MKKFLSLFLCLILLFGLLPMAPPPARAAEIVDSGTCGANGDNLTWTLDSDGVLNISGEGEMADYATDDSAPWYMYRDSIHSAVIDPGVTSIGETLFDRCSIIEIYRFRRV